MTKKAQARRMQRERQKKVKELEEQARKICQDMAKVMNQPISASPEKIRALYARLNEVQRAIDKLVGTDRSDEIVSRIYSEIVKSE